MFLHLAWPLGEGALGVSNEGPSPIRLADHADYITVSKDVQLSRRVCSANAQSRLRVLLKIPGYEKGAGRCWMVGEWWCRWEGKGRGWPV